MLVHQGRGSGGSWGPGLRAMGPWGGQTVHVEGTVARAGTSPGKGRCSVPWRLCPAWSGWEGTWGRGPRGSSGQGGEHPEREALGVRRSGRPLVTPEVALPSPNLTSQCPARPVPGLRVAQGCLPEAVTPLAPLVSDPGPWTPDAPLPSVCSDCPTWPQPSVRWLPRGEGAGGKLVGKAPPSGDARPPSLQTAGRLPAPAQRRRKTSQAGGGGSGRGLLSPCPSCCLSLLLSLLLSVPPAALRPELQRWLRARRLSSTQVPPSFWS